MAAAQRLASTWSDIERSDVFAGSLIGRLATLARTRTHLHENDTLRATLDRGAADRADRGPPGALRVRGGEIEQAAEHWFTAGPLVDAVLASAAVPGILPPVELGGEHFIDGGIVNSIPVGRAVALGADADLRHARGPRRPAAGAAALAVGGRRWSRSRSRAGTASSAISPRCRTMSRST